jgi:hypothetical protein
MMAKRREARHDPLEMAFPTAHCPIGASITKPGGACLAAAAVTAMEICAVSGISCRKVDYVKNVRFCEAERATPKR